MSLAGRVSHLGLARLFRRSGERTRAEGHLGTAEVMLREMGTPVWLAHAEAERRALA